MKANGIVDIAKLRNANKLQDQLTPSTSNIEITATGKPAPSKLRVEAEAECALAEKVSYASDI